MIGIPKRRKNTNKGDYGHVLVIAGAPGFTGAAALCARATLLCGSGLSTLGIARGLNTILARKLTEVMTKPLPETKSGALSEKAFAPIMEFSKKADCVAIGPGLSRDPSTQRLVRKLIVSLRKPMVLDADGLNAIEGCAPLLKRARASVVVTPHPGEMARLTGMRVEDISRNKERVAKTFANKYNVVCVLKGHRTVVARPQGKQYVNKTGNPGMAKGGTGDVLTGMIASFIGQGMGPFEAASLSVYLHGLAGDLAAKEKGEASMLASDLLDKIPEAIKRFTK
ncbi:MAG TPA: NAD(P)H-hydrate dehydratase [Candidatus Omnitrophota bacterium]|nr:NAD(P)H-hydrate dehydratase [Candidatus Omnitrophota bacterium]HPN66898.1 NAD(P)H-hydrate dehydratase [Candidatus Omnitrophota bacterium]